MPSAFTLQACPTAACWRTDWAASCPSASPRLPRLRVQWAWTVIRSRRCRSSCSTVPPIRMCLTTAGSAKPLTFAQWARLDGCRGVAERTVNAPVTYQRFLHCTGGSEVSLYTVEGYGHQWPGGKPGLRHANVDPPYPGLSATDAMWDFF